MPKTRKSSIADRYISKRQSNIFEHYNVLKTYQAYKNHCNYTRHLTHLELQGNTEKVFNYNCLPDQTPEPLVLPPLPPSIPRLIPQSNLEAPGLTEDFYSHPICTHKDVFLAALDYSFYHYTISTKTAVLICHTDSEITCVDIDKRDSSFGIATRSGEIRIYLDSKDKKYGGKHKTFTIIHSH